MKVLVDKLDLNTNKIKEINNNIEEELLNIYNQYDYITLTWKDGYKPNFINNIEINKNKINLIVEEINDLISILSYIKTNYSEIGNNIDVEMNAFNQIDNNYKYVYNSINKVIKKYNNLDSNFSNINDTLNSEKNTLIIVKNNILDDKNKVKALYNKLNNIENELKSRINKFKVVDFLNYTNHKSSPKEEEATMDIDAFDGHLNKLKIHRNSLNIEKDKLQELFNEIPYYFDTKLTNKLTLIFDDIINKLIKIDNQFTNDSLFLENRKSAYIETAMAVSKSFEKLGDL